VQSERRSGGSAASARSKFLLNVGLPLLIGGLIYLAWGSPTLTMFRWLDLARITIQPLRGAVAIFAPQSNLILFSLPNALWGYAVVSFYCLVWSQQQQPVARMWIVIGCVLAVAPEIAQAVRIVPGTFDRVDLLTVSAAAYVALCRHGRFVFMRGSDVSLAA
jgi:hypothetical protein